MKYKIMAFVLLFTLMGGGLSAQEEKPAKKRMNNYLLTYKTIDL